MSDWRYDAACLDKPFDLFWPDGKGAVEVDGLAVCIGCPVRSECLAEALSRPAHDDAGVWGGTLEIHRRKVRHGGWSPHQAMQSGDQLVERHDRALHRQAEREPWLGGAA